MNSSAKYFYTGLVTLAVGFGLMSKSVDVATKTPKPYVMTIHSVMKDNRDRVQDSLMTYKKMDISQLDSTGIESVLTKIHKFDSSYQQLNDVIQKLENDTRYKQIEKSYFDQIEDDMTWAGGFLFEGVALMMAGGQLALMGLNRKRKKPDSDSFIDNV